MQGRTSYRPGTAESAFVTPIFTIGNRTSNVEVETTADVQNNWIGFDYALINADTGDAFDFAREVSYYSGTDSDGRWTEGSQHDSAVLPTIAPGRYYLRVEPETDATSPPISYKIALRRDVPSPEYYLMALGVLLVPPIFVTLRSAAFESRRWQESDLQTTMTMSEVAPWADCLSDPRRAGPWGGRRRRLSRVEPGAADRAPQRAEVDSRQPGVVPVPLPRLAALFGGK